MFAILIGKGCKTKNVEVLSKEILSNFGGLIGFLKASVGSLLKLPGIGNAKVASLLAAKELVNRFKLIHLQSYDKNSTIKLQDISELLYLRTVREFRECFFLVLFGADNHLIHIELLSKGGLEEVGVYPREIAKVALDYGAKSILISHNHPNADAVPSRKDIILLERLREILRPLEITVIDQLTIGKNGVYSSDKKNWTYKQK
ncbi:MAG: hypothetical protein L6Q54_13900 [Leptospiraceae bacterium]|nr:hypothetical protein [Leptospiraceae bacterium]